MSGLTSFVSCNCSEVGRDSGSAGNSCIWQVDLPDRPSKEVRPNGLVSLVCQGKQLDPPSFPFDGKWTNEVPDPLHEYVGLDELDSFEEAVAVADDVSLFVLE